MSISLHLDPSHLKWFIDTLMRPLSLRMCWKHRRHLIKTVITRKVLEASSTPYNKYKGFRDNDLPDGHCSSFYKAEFPCSCYEWITSVDFYNLNNSFFEEISVIGLVSGCLAWLSFLQESFELLVGTRVSFLLSLSTVIFMSKSIIDLNSLQRTIYRTS